MLLDGCALVCSIELEFCQLLLLKGIMATQYIFITEPPKSRFCPICFELLTEPCQIVKCGHHVCQQCHTQLVAIGKKECPVCREPDALSSAYLDKFLQREINDIKVRCQHHREGCKWTGEVRDLQSHLDPDKRRCNYVLLPCSFGCSERRLSGAMRDHLKRYCTKRQMSCQYCSYCSSYDIVIAKHLPICLQVPVTCPNNCKKKGLKRKQLQAHIDECPLQVISCPFTSAGCTVKLPRNEMEKHEDTAMRQHLRLLIKLHLNQETSTPPAATISPPFLYNQAPMEFIISDYHEKKEANEKWYSSPFYTHNRGYKFRLEVYTNGNVTGRGSHLSVGAQLMRGEYDNELEWPFEGDIRVELLNWREDKNHHSYVIPFNRYHDPVGQHSSRRTNQETAPGFGTPRFISHTDLASTTNKEYLRDDYLKLRVSVAVYSTPLLPLTPAWQDPLISTQSGAQFTISKYSKHKRFNNEYCSPPFTTSPQGYTLCLIVYANGRCSGKGSHLSIYAYIMKGQHDGRLQWPFTGTIIIELLNWLEDKEHYKKTLPISTKHDFVRVTEGEFGNNYGYYQFISQSSLTSSTTNTQYLYQDCIRVRVQATPNN